MENKNSIPVFTFGTVAIILGVVLYKQFDFKTLQFEKPALGFLYLIVFIFSVYVLVKHYLKRNKK